MTQEMMQASVPNNSSPAAVMPAQIRIGEIELHLRSCGLSRGALRKWRHQHPEHLPHYLFNRMVRLIQPINSCERLMSVDDQLVRASALYLLLQRGFTLDQLTSVFNSDSNFLTLVELAEHERGDDEFNLLSLLIRAGTSPQVIIEFINLGKNTDFFASLLWLNKPVRDENGLLMVTDSKTVQTPLSILRNLGISDAQIIESISSPEGQRRLEVLVGLSHRRHYTTQNPYIGNTSVAANVLVMLQQLGFGGETLFSILSGSNGEACLNRLLSEIVTHTSQGSIVWINQYTSKPVLWIEYLLTYGITIETLVALVQIPGAFELFVDLEQRRHLYLIRKPLELKDFFGSFDMNLRPVYREAIILLLHHNLFREIMTNQDIRNQFVSSCSQYLSDENSARVNFMFLLAVLNDRGLANQFRAWPQLFASLLQQLETLSPEDHLNLAGEMLEQIRAGSVSGNENTGQAGWSSARFGFFPNPVASGDENRSDQFISSHTSTGP